MSIFAISDLHLSLGMDKPMDIFGDKWVNYTEKMKDRWNRVVTDEDWVIVPGDISWATYMEDAEADFEYINSLNGKKLLLKGNHDYWWTTNSKMSKFLDEHGFDTITILKNNACIIGNVAVCGTRGWTIPPQGAQGGEEVRIFEREKQRFILSLEDARSKGAEKIIAALHYPPVDGGSEDSDFMRIMREYGVAECVFGHLHAASHRLAPVGVRGGIRLRLVSCDYIDFTPQLIEKCI